MPAKPLSPRSPGRHGVTAPESLLTPQDVAAQLCVSVATVYRLINGLELRSVRIGRSIRVSCHAVNEYLDRQTVHGVPTSEGRIVTNVCGRAGSGGTPTFPALAVSRWGPRMRPRPSNVSVNCSPLALRDALGLRPKRASR